MTIQAVAMKMERTMSEPISTGYLLQYVVEMQSSSLNSCLLLNGIEIASYTAKRRSISSQKVNGWLVYGDNELELRAAVDDPAHLPGPVALKCLLFRSLHGKQPDESEALASYVERDLQKMPVGQMQTVWRKTFQPNPYYGPWSWERGYPMAPDKPTMAAAMSLVAHILSLLDAGRADQLVEIYRVYIDENVRAYEMDAAALEAQLRAWCGGWKQLNDWVLREEDYEFIPEARQRLLQVRRKDRESVFGASGSDVIYLAHLPIGLVLVR
jgi:hypothetical protein